MRAVLIALVAALLATAGPARAAKAPVDFGAVVAEIAAEADAAVANYEPGAGHKTADVFSHLYFDVFEESGMESAVGLADPGRKRELESLFGKVIGLATQAAPKADVIAAWRSLDERLRATAAEQPPAATQGAQTTAWATALQSFLILLREGFEALLVVTALIAYLRRSGAAARVRIIWHGVGWALAASLVTAWAFEALFEVSGKGREALEGVTLLIAAAVLFYVSYWLFAKREAARWQRYVQGQIDKALAGNQVFALGFASFLAVYREGAETVLFYQALLAGSGGHEAAVAGGFAGAVVALGALYWVMRSASLRLPLGVFFAATAVLLYYLSIRFAGTGILELQEAQWVSITPVAWLPRIDWLGLFPTVESLAAQVAILAPLPVAALWWMSRRQRLAAAVEKR